MSSMTIQTEAQKRNVWAAIPPAERSLQPTPLVVLLFSLRTYVSSSPPSVCDSIRVLLYDLGMVDRDTFGSEIVPLDSGQRCFFPPISGQLDIFSADFYRDLHEIVDSCPSRSLQTAHIFYVKEGQRSAVDILDNALNIQNTSADFCGFLSELGEGIEAGVHDSWTGHWSTAFSSERSKTIPYLLSITRNVQNHWKRPTQSTTTSSTESPTLFGGQTLTARLPS